MGLGKEADLSRRGATGTGSVSARAGLELLVGGAGGRSVIKRVGKAYGAYVSFFSFLLIFCLLQIVLFIPRKCLLGKHTEKSIHLFFCVDFFFFFSRLRGK